MIQKNENVHNYDVGIFLQATYIGFSLNVKVYNLCWITLIFHFNITPLLNAMP